jgi:hypothetical protein
MSTYKLGPLGNLNQVIGALGKTIRAMADGSIDSQTGARICNGLGIMRACLETQVLQNIEDKLEKAADRWMKRPQRISESYTYDRGGVGTATIDDRTDVARECRSEPRIGS